MTDSNKPIIHPIGNAAAATWARINDTRAGKYDILRTRFADLNKVINEGFVFNSLVLIGGASGHGKSYLLQMLKTDFLDNNLNQTKKPWKMLCFNLEMSMTAEMLRELASKTGISYSDMIAYGDKNKLTEKQLTKISQELRRFQDEDRVYIINTTHNKHVVKETIQDFQKMFPSHQLIITLDHTLLIEQMDEKSEVQLAADIGKMFIEVRNKYNSLNLLVAQLNDKIEDVRRKEIGYQFPTKTDIHGSKQIYQASDMVFVVHRPEFLNIEVYGRSPSETFQTKDMIALHMLKHREGESNIWMRFTQDFNHGTLLPFNEQSSHNYNIQHF